MYIVKLKILQEIILRGQDLKGAKPADLFVEQPTLKSGERCSVKYLKKSVAKILS